VVLRGLDDMAQRTPVAAVAIATPRVGTLRAPAIY
jgi:hypothetical protein